MYRSVLFFAATLPAVRIANPVAEYIDGYAGRRETVLAGFGNADKQHPGPEQCYRIYASGLAS